MTYLRKLVLAVIAVVLLAGFVHPAASAPYRKPPVGSIYLNDVLRSTPILRYNRDQVYRKFGPQKGTDPYGWIYNAAQTDGVYFKFFEPTQAYVIEQQIGGLCASAQFVMDTNCKWAISFTAYPPPKVSGYRISKKVDWVGSVHNGGDGHARRMILAYIPLDAKPEIGPTWDGYRHYRVARYDSVIRVEYDLMSRRSYSAYVTTKFDPTTYAQKETFNARAFLQDAYIQEYCEGWGSWTEEVR